MFSKFVYKTLCNTQVEIKGFLFKKINKFIKNYQKFKFLSRKITRPIIMDSIEFSFCFVLFLLVRSVLQMVKVITNLQVNLFVFTLKKIVNWFQISIFLFNKWKYFFYSRKVGQSSQEICKIIFPPNKPLQVVLGSPSNIHL